MKKKQRALYVIATTVILLIFAVSVVYLTDSNEFSERTFIVFSNVEFDTATQDDLIFVPYDEIREHKSSYSKYNQYTYYEHLKNSEDATVYKIFEYALDHSYSNVFIDDKIIAETEYAVMDIFTFLSLDSAIVEQNNDNYTYESIELTFVGESKLKIPVEASVYGNVLNMEIFTNDALKRKKLAVKKAEEVVASLPQGLTDVEKTTYFYEYLNENVEYLDYKEQKEEPNYLYDTFINGKTNCDGYANAFSLLCKLEGIPCFEKIYFPSVEENEKENEDKKTEKKPKIEVLEGHTWNAVKLGDKWYNVDATNSDFYFEARGVDKIYLYYGFSDKYQDYEHAYKELIPECTDNLLVPDCTLKSFADSDAVSKMKKAFYDNDSKYILVYSESAESYDSKMQRLANALYTSIYHESYEGKFHNFYFIYPA